MTIENNQDWANLEKYKEANQELIKSHSGRDRTVFIGDSITESWSDSVSYTHLTLPTILLV